MTFYMKNIENIIFIGKSLDNLGTKYIKILLELINLSIIKMYHCISTVSMYLYIYY